MVAVSFRDNDKEVDRINVTSGVEKAHGRGKLQSVVGIHSREMKTVILFMINWGSSSFR